MGTGETSGMTAGTGTGEMTATLTAEMTGEGGTMTVVAGMTETMSAGAAWRTPRVFRCDRDGLAIRLTRYLLPLAGVRGHLQKSALHGRPRRWGFGRRKRS